MMTIEWVIRLRLSYQLTWCGMLEWI